MEAIYVDIFKDIGFRHFAPVQIAKGNMFSARARSHRAGEPESAAPVTEEEFYS